MFQMGGSSLQLRGFQAMVLQWGRDVQKNQVEIVDGENESIKIFEIGGDDEQRPIQMVNKRRGIWKKRKEKLN